MRTQAKERRRSASPEVAARIKREAGSGRVDSGGRGSRGGRSSLPLSVSVTPSGTAVFGELAVMDQDADSDADLDAGPVSTPTELHFGVALRRAREQRGLSLHELAERTRISVRWLDALEDARTDQLPAPVFVIGYLRSYARALGLSGDEVVERYRAWQQRDSLPPAAEPYAAGTGALAQRRALILTLVLVLVGLAALVGYFFLRVRH